MIVAYDMVAHEIDLDFEDGRPVVTLPAERLLVKVYANEAILIVETLGSEIEVGLVPVEQPLGILRIVPLGALTWKVMLSDPEEPT